MENSHKDSPPLRECRECGGNVMEFIRDEEESIIECRQCRRVWTIAELWNRSPSPPVEELVSALKECNLYANNPEAVMRLADLALSNFKASQVKP